MQKLLTMMGMTVGGYVGWAIGAPVGFFTAFMVSMVGTAAGLYAARRLADRLLPYGLSGDWRRDPRRRAQWASVAAFVHAA